MSAEDEEQSMIQDWQAAVEDLKDNVRHEIITLTNLARELTSIAYPIAEILEQHIKKAPPQRKLPAIYLLDSIVKNVGTPYTLFFGKNLYATFMEVYASVDQRTRQKLEEMLQTWKEPVPGSIDSTPVFPPDVVRPIENALIKARTSALQAQQEQMRSQMRARGGRPPPGMQYRATPTPPNARTPFNQPPYPAANGQQPQYPQAQAMPYPVPTPPQGSGSIPGGAPFAPPQGYYGGLAGQAGISIDSLNNDMEQLIVAVGSALGRSPQSSDIQTELKALLALQGLLRDKQKTLPPEQVMAVRNQVDHLAVKYRVSFVARQSVAPTPPLPAAPFHAPMHSHPHHTPHQQQPHAAPPVTPVPPPSAATPVSLDALLGKGALAALLGRQSATPQPPHQHQAPPSASSTPQLGYAAAAAALPSSASQRTEPHKPPTPDPMALLASLRGAGLLSTPTPSQQQAPGAGAGAGAGAPPLVSSAIANVLAGLSTPTNNTPAIANPPPPPPSSSSVLGGGAGGLDLASIIAKAQSIAATAKAVPVISSGDISFTAGSLKQPRPHLIHSLYEALGPQCTQCGRRFPADEEGKEKKSAHMDWHFRVKQRMVEAEKRGQHRSWYVDQADWIRNIESIDLEHTSDPNNPNNDDPFYNSSHHPDGTAGNSSSGDRSAADGGGVGAGGAGGKAAGSGRKAQWIPVPDDSATAKINNVCPICQEKFETVWLDEAQEWVWIDTMRVGGRAFHASCYAEVAKESGGSGGVPLYGGAGGVGAARATPERVLGKRKAEDDALSLRGGRLKTEQ